MREQTYLEYALAVSWYLENEWPTAAAATSASEGANRAAARACLGCFIAGADVPRAANAVALAIEQLAQVE